MVTLPAQAAADDALVAALVEGGMDIARINCAHDGAGCVGGDGDAGAPGGPSRSAGRCAS